METINEEFNLNLDRIFGELDSSFHHAFLLETKNREFIFNYFKNKLENISGDNNESLFINLKVFDIEKARSVIDYGKTSFGSQHFVVISFYSITREAQNSLLKFLEEAGKNIKIILIVHFGANIINTVLSRLYRLDLNDKYFVDENGESEFLEVAAEKFLSSKSLMRMKLKEIVEILAKKDEYALEFEDKDRSDREILEKLLLNIYNKIYKSYASFLENYKQNDKETNDSLSMKEYQNKEYLSILEDVSECIRYTKNNSSSGKTILEYLALRLPEVD